MILGDCIYFDNDEEIKIGLYIGNNKMIYPTIEGKVIEGNIDSHNKIKTISVGTNRNSLLSYLDDNNHPKISGNYAINFGSYSLNGYGYSGDWRSQKLLLKI